MTLVEVRIQHSGWSGGETITLVDEPGMRLHTLVNRLGMWLQH